MMGDGTIRISRALVAALTFAFMAVGTGAQQVGTTPMEVRVPAPPVPTLALGRTHLAYEVHLTNFGAAPMSLERLDVVARDGGAVGSWSGAQLRQRVMTVGHAGAPDPGVPTRLAPGARAVVFLWVTLEAGQAAPDSLIHRVTASAEGAAPFVTATAPVVLTAPHHVPLGAPVHGGPWVAVRGPSPTSGHRLSLVALDGVVRVPQRFAVDWVRLGDDGRLFGNEGAAVTDWSSYNAPVVAVADGAVVLVRDGVADTTPRTPAPSALSAADAPGNVVVLDLGDRRFVTYAHLKAGSIVVKEGDHVQAGQALARIGNSGNSLGPHLHFQVSDAIEPLGGEGLPFLMDRFELVGRVPGLGPLLMGTPWTAQTSQPARQVRGETPLENMVVRFGPR